MGKDCEEILRQSKFFYSSRKLWNIVVVLKPKFSKQTISFQEVIVVRN